MVKNLPVNVGDLGLSPGLGRSPGGGHVNSLQYSCLENPHGQRSLTGYSPWGHRESDMTEHVSTVLFKQLVCDTGLTRQVVGEQRPRGKGL